MAGAPKKAISAREKDFARLLEEVGLGAIEAYRQAFKSKCEDKKEQQKANDLARSVRVKEERARLRQVLSKQKQAQTIVSQTGLVDVERLRDFAYKRLVEIRDDPNVKGATRFQAVKALKMLHDPSRDSNLIMRWVDLAWKYQKVHCPCCHNSYPLYEIQNNELKKYREANEDTHTDVASTDYERRFELIQLADPRLRPHEGQKIALAAPERHIVGQGAARAGKSYLMALFAVLTFLLPGVEIWVLARIYEDARSEVEYMKKFLRALFYPYYDYMVKEHEDKKSGELTFVSRWGSELKIRSAKAKGSIIGRELELALVAEPGWVEAELYDQLRARMSSRLGRIIALGTPQGTAGMIGRMVRMTGRDPKTGRIVRRSPEERLITSGSPWNVSMLVYKLDPSQNPGYVKSELEAARMELTDEEYATEFAGEMAQIEGAKFIISDKHLQKIPRNFFEKAAYSLGIDQGPKNFGACLTAYDGKLVVPCYEYFNGDETTMKRNLITLYKEVPKWISKLGGDPRMWSVTVTDRNPLLDGIFEELEEEGYRWPTEITLSHKNNTRLNENWRRELQEWVNNLSRKGRLLFHLSDEIAMNQDIQPGASLLHDQVMNAMDVAEDPERESKTDSKKGWTINDAWRGDHVVDAWYFTMWSIVSGQLTLRTQENTNVDEEDPWKEHRAAFELQLARDEYKELYSGGRGSESPRKAPQFEDFFGRKRSSGPMISPGWYGDES